MIHNLFDEYRFFSRYPDRELLITATLFGALIKHGLVSSITLGMALRYVLDALRKPAPSKMFTFGLKVSGDANDRLSTWQVAVAYLSGAARLVRRSAASAFVDPVLACHTRLPCIITHPTHA